VTIVLGAKQKRSLNSASDSVLRILTALYVIVSSGLAGEMTMII
jgi:hypothetical protein